jgi:hypothetical protein
MRSFVAVSLLYCSTCLLSVGCVPPSGGERSETGACPDGETCSEKTPKGLHFDGAAPVGQGFSASPPTAIGGTQQIKLEYDPGDGKFRELDLPYTATAGNSPAFAVASTVGNVVTVRGLAAGHDFLRILDADDGTLFDRRMLEAAPLTSVELVVGDPGFLGIPDEYPDGARLAWRPNAEHDMGIALRGPANQRIADTSMKISAPGVDQSDWDQFSFDSGPVGTFPVTVNAAGETSDVDVVVVEKNDGVVAIEPPASIKANGSSTVCFGATYQDRYVVGMGWQFTVDGTTLYPYNNCLDVKTTKSSGTVTIEATAGGLSTTITLPIAAG